MKAFPIVFPLFIYPVNQAEGNKRVVNGARGLKIVPPGKLIIQRGIKRSTGDMVIGLAGSYQPVGNQFNSSVPASPDATRVFSSASVMLRTSGVFTGLQLLFAKPSSLRSGRTDPVSPAINGDHLPARAKVSLTGVCRVSSANQPYSSGREI